MPTYEQLQQRIESAGLAARGGFHEQVDIYKKYLEVHNINSAKTEESSLNSEAIHGLNITILLNETFYTFI